MTQDTSIYFSGLGSHQVGMKAPSMPRTTTATSSAGSPAMPQPMPGELLVKVLQ